MFMVCNECAGNYGYGFDAYGQELDTVRKCRACKSETAKPVEDLLRFTMPTWAWQNVRPEIAKALAKAQKKGQTGGEFSLQVTGTEVRQVTSPNTLRKYPVEYTTVELTGGQAAFALPGGYKFIGIADRVGEASLVGRARPGYEIPLDRLETPSMVCEHCKTSRRRKQFLFLENAEGKLLQVGTDCAQDFLGKSSVASLLWNADLVRQIGSCEEDDFGGFFSGRDKYHSVLEIVTIAIGVIRAEGFISRARAEEKDLTPTSCRVSTVKFASPVFNPEDARLRQEILGNQEFWDLAAEVLEWALELPGTSAYAHNVRALAKAGSVEAKHIGIIASIPAAYQREKEKALTAAQEPKKERLASEYIGSVKERLRGLEVELRFPPKYFDGQFDVSTLYRFETASGSVLTWFASGSDPLGIDTKGQEYPLKLKVDATVKAHEDYKGVKQTKVNRVKVLAG